jgi:hypothetical protein
MWYIIVVKRGTTRVPLKSINCSLPQVDKKEVIKKLGN